MIFKGHIGQSIRALASICLIICLYLPTAVQLGHHHEHPTERTDHRAKVEDFCSLCELAVSDVQSGIILPTLLSIGKLFLPQLQFNFFDQHDTILPSIHLVSDSRGPPNYM